MLVIQLYFSPQYLQVVCRLDYPTTCNYTENVSCVCSQRKNKQKPAYGLQNSCWFDHCEPILKGSGRVFLPILPTCWGSKILS